MKYAFTCLLLISLVTFQPGNGQLMKVSDSLTDGLIVRLAKGNTPETVSAEWQRRNHRLLSGEFISLVPALNVWHFRPEKRQFDQQALQALSAVAYAYVNKRVHLRERIPNDTEYAKQYYMDLIEAPKVWDITTGGRTANDTEIVIAVFDGGCDLLHEDLAEQIWTNQGEIPNDGLDNDQNGYIDDYAGWNVINKNDDHPASMHGTPVAGLVGARGNNDTGVTGVNWAVKLLIISGAEGYESEVLAGYNYIFEMRQAWNESNGTKGAFIVASNSSFGIEYFRGGTPENHPDWCDMYDLLGSVGILNAGATINEGVDVDEVGDIPSACDSDYLITVTNTNAEDRKVSNAGYGKTTIDLGAPGDDAFTTDVFDAYDEFGGTSAAAPQVAGAIGLLYSIPSLDFALGAEQSPAETALLVKEVILNTVDTISSLEERTVSFGRLNLFRAMTRLAQEVGNKPGEAVIHRIYPNPADEFVVIDFRFRDYETEIPFQVFNSAGQQVYAQPQRYPYFGDTTVEINTSAWTPGVYYITMLVDGDFITKPLVVH